MKRVATVAVLHGGHLLMGKRRDNGRWTCPGGHLNEGEMPAPGAQRELWEESGISASSLKQIGHDRVTKPDGQKLEVTAYVYRPTTKPKTSMRSDPDLEVQRWQWINISRGLPQHIAANLHVPLERNVLLKGLGVKAMEKTAFWAGFDKQAMIPVGALAAGVTSNLGRSALAGVKRVVRANPMKTLAAGAGLGAVGFGAGRATSGQTGPRYPY